MGALGHTLTPAYCVFYQFFIFLGHVHVLEMSIDDVHPVFPWAPFLSLVTCLSN